MIEYLKAHKNYLIYFARHKYWVYRIGRKCYGLSRWRLLIHDWSKLMPDEWFGYVKWKFKQVQDEAGGTNENNRNYGRSWHLHYARNPHHYQHWIYLDDSTGECVTIEMPDIYKEEMMADWAAAGIVRFGKPGMRDFFEANKTVFQKAMAPDTFKWVELYLDWIDSMFKNYPDSVS